MEASANSAPPLDRAVTPRAGIPRAITPKVGTHRAVISRVLQGRQTVGLRIQSFLLMSGVFSDPCVVLLMSSWLS